MRNRSWTSSFSRCRPYVIGWAANACSSLSIYLFSLVFWCISCILPFYFSLFQWDHLLKNQNAIRGLIKTCLGWIASLCFSLCWKVLFHFTAELCQINMCRIPFGMNWFNLVNRPYVRLWLENNNAMMIQLLLLTSGLGSAVVQFLWQIKTTVAWWYFLVF